jgi:hypothetical protein
LFGGFTVRDEGDGTLTLGLPGEPEGSVANTFDGLAVPGLGVVAMNLPDPPEDWNPDGQKGSAEGSQGRLLPGVEARVLALGSETELPVGETGELKIAGVAGDWVKANPRARFDEEGFLWLS